MKIRKPKAEKEGDWKDNSKPGKTSFKRASEEGNSKKAPFKKGDKFSKPDTNSRTRRETEKSFAPRRKNNFNDSEERAFKRPEKREFGEKRFGDSNSTRNSYSSGKRRSDSGERGPSRGFKSNRFEEEGGGKRSFKPDRTESGEKPSFKRSGKREFSSDKDFSRPAPKGRERGDRENAPFKKRERQEGSENKSFKRSEDKPFRRSEDKPFRRSEDKPFSRSEDKPFKKTTGDKPFRRSEDKPYKKTGDKPFNRSEDKSFKKTGDKPFNRAERGGETRDGFKRKGSSKSESGFQVKKFAAPTKDDDKSEGDENVRLNRYISNAGVCSRRDADLLIESGEIKVNGKVVTELGYKVGSSDIVKYGNRVLNKQKLVYVLLNKPKDYITTTEDPEERKTVMDLVKGANEQRIYPVGRLDRNTTGLLLLTNDGELAEKLTHPSNEIKKVYQVELDKALSEEDFQKIIQGLVLEDGPVKVDDLAYVTPDGMVVGIELHSGRNRIVRRIFEHLGYEVLKLDRVAFAGLTKKDLPRGRWRTLSEKEVIRLRYFL